MHKTKASAAVWTVWIVLTILIAGGLVYYYQYTKIPDLQNQINDLQNQVASLQEQVSAQEDETADWETYTNSTYGYSIKYPNGWENKELDNYAWFDAGEIKSGGDEGGYDALIAILVSSDSQSKIISDYAKKSQENIDLDNIEATKYSTIDPLTKEDLIIVIGEKNNKSYVFFFKADAIDILDDMLSTFQFTP